MEGYGRLLLGLATLVAMVGYIRIKRRAIADEGILELEFAKRIGVAERSIPAAEETIGNG